MPRLLIFCAIVTFVLLIFAYPSRVEDFFQTCIDWMKENKELGVVMTVVFCFVATSIGTPGVL